MKTCSNISSSIIICKNVIESYRITIQFCSSSSNIICLKSNMGQQKKKKIPCHGPHTVGHGSASQEDGHSQGGPGPCWLQTWAEIQTTTSCVQLLEITHMNIEKYEDFTISLSWLDVKFASVAIFNQPSWATLWLVMGSARVPCMNRLCPIGSPKFLPAPLFLGGSPSFLHLHQWVSAYLRSMMCHPLKVGWFAIVQWNFVWSKEV